MSGFYNPIMVQNVAFEFWLLHFWPLIIVLDWGNTITWKIMSSIKSILNVKTHKIFINLYGGNILKTFSQAQLIKFSLVVNVKNSLISGHKFLGNSNALEDKLLNVSFFILNFLLLHEFNILKFLTINIYYFWWPIET